jgi:serine protease
MAVSRIAASIEHREGGGACAWNFPDHLVLICVDRQPPVSVCREETVRRLLATIPLALAVAAALAAPAPATEATGVPVPAFVPGEVVVGLEDGRQKVVELPPDLGVKEGVREIRERSDVAFAHPNYIARAAGVPNDRGLFGRPGDWRRTQWNFLPCGSLCGQSASPLAFQARGGINALAAWKTLKRRGRGGGVGATVAVVDTGVAFKTRKPRFRRSPDFSPKQFLRGRDFVDPPKKKKKGRKSWGVPLDQDGHGTHVAGTIAERTGNKIGLTGLAPKAKIIPVRVLDAQGFGTATDISRGIRFAADRGADIINMSFEFAVSVDRCTEIKTVCSAIKYAAKRGSVIVAAAGNSNGQPIAFPAGAPNVIGVGRTTKDACIADDSRTGAGLDLVAPGGGVPMFSSCGGNDPLFRRGETIYQMTLIGPGFKRFGFPGDYEGTSMAAAHVSGVAAMIVGSRVLGKDPKPAAIECQLEATARRSAGQLGQDYDSVLFGAGLVDAAAAVAGRAPGC